MLSKEQIQYYLNVTDPLADNIVKKVIESGSLDEMRSVYQSLRENVDVNQQQLPEVIKGYFIETKGLVIYANQELIGVGEQVFVKYGPQISLCLLCKSLPEAYVCANGAKVLYTTGRMTEQNGNLNVFTRRLMETAQFVINVCSPGGLSEKGNGIITAQKVRLIHASIRYYIHQRGWDAESYGEPINQLDMAGTLQSFSSLILEGLDMLGIELSDKEKEGFYHIWHVIGHTLGVDPSLNPATFREGYKLGKAILDDQKKQSQEGEELTKAVIDFMKQLTPGNLFDDAPETIIRYLIGDEMANMLGVSKHQDLLDRMIPKLMGHIFEDLSEIENKHIFIRKLVEHFNQLMLQGMLNHFNGHKKVRFYIPPSLRTNWNLNA